MEKNLGRKVEVGDITMSWSEGVEVRNLLIKEREGVPGDAFVKVDRFYCDIQFVPLIKKQIRIRELVIDNPVVVVHRFVERGFDGGSSKTPESKSSSEKEQKRVPGAAHKQVEKQVLPALALPFALDVELKARVNNGTFTFVDHRIHEKTVIKDFGTTLTIESLDKPIELKSAFNIDAKGETEHADISMKVSLARDGEVNPRYARGVFNLKTGFAKVSADFDMAGFSGEGGRGFEFLLDADMKGMTEKLAGILGLPEGVQIEGVCNSKITASGRVDELINIDGKTELVNLNVFGGLFKDKPIKDLNVKLLQSADLDLANDKIKIYRFGFDSVFAQMGVTGLITDLRNAVNLDLKMFLNSDIAALAGEIGGILPEDGEFAGKIQSDITLQGQRTKPRVDGKTVITDFFLNRESFGPVSEKEIIITHNATVDASGKSLTIREVGLVTSFAELGVSGLLNHEKDVDINVILEVNDLEKLSGSISGIVPLPDGLSVSGKTTTEMNIRGDRENGVRLSGHTELDGVNATGGPLKDSEISNLNLKLLHDISHVISKNELTIEQLDIDSDFLSMRSKGEVRNVSRDMDVDYGSSLTLNLNETVTQFSDFLPVGMVMTGKGNVDLTLRGKLPVDDSMYGELVLQGNMFMESIEYNGNTVTDMKSLFRLDNGIFNTDDFTFGINEGKGEISVKAILVEEQPPVEFSLDLTDVLINQKIDTLGRFIQGLSGHGGEISGVLDMDIAGKGKGLNWQEELSRTLSALGHIRIENGSIKGVRAISQIIRDKVFEFEEITTPIRIEDGKIFTEDLQVNGSKLDVGLSGWTALDGRIEYTVESEVLAKYIGGDAEDILGMLGKGLKLPTVITGTIDKPKVALRFPESEEGFGNLIEGVIGSLVGEEESGGESEGTSEEQRELKSGESSGEEESGKIETEEIVEKLFKSLFN